MDFPPFEHLLYYERVHGARLNISYSNIREFHLDGFGRSLPRDLDLNWTFRNGTPEIRRLIARRHRASSQEVLVTTGATEGNFLVNTSLVHPRDRVLVDETFRELAFDDTPPSVAEFGPRMIALSTVTKVGGLGTLRVGWIVGAPDLLDRFAGIKDYTTGGGSVLSQTIATWALGRWDFFLRRAKRILDVNRKLAAEALREMPDLQGDVPSRGTVLFPHSTVDVARLASRLLKRYGTVIAEGRFFGVPDHFRLGLGGETQDLKRGLANLRRLLRSAS